MNVQLIDVIYVVQQNNNNKNLNHYYMSKRVRFNNPISTTSGGGGGLTNFGLIASSLMPRTFCSSNDDSIYCIIARILGFLFMIVMLYIVCVFIYRIATGKMNLMNFFN